MSKTASLPVVHFRCDVLNARLSVRSCVAQYDAAQEKKRTRSRHTTGAYIPPCTDCEIGKAHRRGQPTPPELIAERPALHLVGTASAATPAAKEPEMPHHTGPRSVQPAHDPLDRSDVPRRTRACVACGETFVPTSNANRYCPACKAGAAKPATPTPEVEKEEVDTEARTGSMDIALTPDGDLAFVDGKDHIRGLIRKRLEREEIDIEPRGIEGAERHTSEAEPALTTTAAPIAAVDIEPRTLVEIGVDGMARPFGIRESQTLPAPEPTCAICERTFEPEFADDTKCVECLAGEIPEAPATPESVATPAEVLTAVGYQVVTTLRVPAGLLIVRTNLWTGAKSVLEGAGFKVTYAEQRCDRHVLVVTNAGDKPNA